VSVWDIQQHREVTAIEKEHEIIILDDISPDGQVLAMHNPAIPQIKLWDALHRRGIGALVGHSPGWISAQFATTTNTLVSVGEDQTIRIWDLASRTEKSRTVIEGLGVGYWRITTPVLSPDGRTAAILERGDGPDPSSGNYPNPRVDIYDLTIQQLVLRHSQSNDTPTVPVYSPNGRMVIMQGGRGNVLYDVDTREEVGQIGNTVHGPYTFSPNGRVLAAFGPKAISLWDVTLLKEIGVLNGNYGSYPYGQVAITPDGKYLAICKDDGDSALWDLTSLQRVANLQVPASGGQFSPDGRLLAIQGLDNAVYLWDVERKEQVQVLKGHGEPINKVLFSPDGRWLITGSDDGTVMIWEAASATLVEESSADGQDTTLPQETRLLPAFPNPFNLGVSIPFVLEKEGVVRLEIRNLAGQQVRTFDLGYKSAGSYAAPGRALWWDGRSATGEECATGVYLYRLHAGTVSTVRRLVLVK
jgi:WD40 repeat protein